MAANVVKGGRARLIGFAVVRGSDQLDERAQAVEGVGDAEARGRNAELAVRRGDAQVGLHGDRKSPAEAEALDRRDARLGEVREPRAAAAGQPRVFLLNI